jgi:hypothetical protein
MKTGTHKRPLVAFTGLAQSGKTTAARVLCRRGYDRMSFADPIKQMVRCLTSETDKNKQLPQFGDKTLRHLYQTLGTDWGRHMIHPNIWVQLGAERLRSLLGDVEEAAIQGVVIDDLRFDNEAQLVRAMGGTVIQVHRPGVHALPHESESGISPHLVDADLDNDACPEALDEAVLALCGLA